MPNRRRRPSIRRVREARRRGSSPPSQRPAPGPASPRISPAPAVRLGRTVVGGVAPTMFALLERGVHRAPELARQMRGRIAFRFAEDYAPLRVSFLARSVAVEDGDFRRPDLLVEGSLPDIVHLATAPHVRGVPNPARVRGRQALAQVARRRVRISGDRALARQVLRLLAIDAA